MAGVFIVSIPQKNHESSNKNKLTRFVCEKEKYDKASKLIHELKENKRFGSRSIEPYVEGNCTTKRKSTESLTSITSTGLYKSKSDKDISVVGVESVRRMKATWEDIRQAMKPKFRTRNKLKRTGVGSCADTLGAFQWDTPLETILSDIMSRLGIYNSTWSATKDGTHWQVVFTVESSNLCEELVEVLRAFGFGSRHRSSVSVLPCALHYASKDEYGPATKIESETSKPVPFWSCFTSSPRTNMRQVIEKVRKDAAVTFHWLCLLLAAAFLAAIGLVESSTVTIVASMIICPLMGPIIAGTLGTVVGDRSLQHMGMIHTMLGLFLCLATGFITGLAICVLDERYGIVGDWPTSEMISRCELRSLWVGILVALPSGACVALTVSGKSTTSLVGVVISASLLPPAVNAGLLWAMALDRLLSSNEDIVWSVLNPGALATLGTMSFCLALINTLAMFLAGVAVYKIKQVCPLEQRDLSWRISNSKLIKLHSETFHDSSISGLKNEQYTEVPEAMAENGVPAPDNTGLVQSDTVTYRRPGLHRLRAQNIEAYCLRKTQFDDNDTPLNSYKTTEGIQNDIEAQPDRLITPINEDLKNTGLQDSYSFYNWAYQDHGDEQRPTLEPSLNFTVPPKNGGVALNTKSFEV